MDREAPAGGPIVRGFAGTGFRLDEGVVHRAVLLTPVGATAWTPPPLAELGVDAVRPLLEQTPEFLLIGTGAALVHPPLALVHALDALGIGVEAMDSRAAARAWGVLRGEGRVIGAALYPLDA